MKITTLTDTSDDIRRMLRDALRDAGPACPYVVLAPDHSPNGITGYSLAVEAATLDTARRAAVGHAQPRIFHRLVTDDGITWTEQKVRDE